jgi:FkbM family methyltransferase
MGQFIASPSAWWALLSWPKFSLTSFRMVSSLMRQGVNPKTVIDVGANVGQFAVASAKVFQAVAVHSFEPEPESLRRLRQNVAKLGNVHVYPLALGEECGVARFHINSHSHSSSILALGERHQTAFPYAREVDTIEVSVSTLDRELASVSLRPPVLLKLDVQGYEPQVLMGGTATLGRVDYVVLEASFRPLYEGERTFLDILGMMRDRGFEFLRPVGWLHDPHSGEILQMDALFNKPARKV